MSRRRGIYFKQDILKMLEAYAQETGSNPSKIVNLVLNSFFSTTLKDHLKEAIELESEREQLIAEERRLFNELKVILRSGVYLEDAERRLLRGIKPGERPSERMAGILSKMPEHISEAVMRIFARREQIANRLAEIEIGTLPESKRTIALTERGWEIIPKVSSEEFVTSYIVRRYEAKG